jgi:pyridoxal phosphate enzyme (YggS family)
LSISENIKRVIASLPIGIDLVAVSKTKPVEQISEAYHFGQRIFGENKVQEMVGKYEELPKDIAWHMIGHIQSNKVKYMASFVNLIHAVDSLKLLKEINKQALKNERVIDCLLQIKIAKEESKFGLTEKETEDLLRTDVYKSLKNIRICGLMGMATFTDDARQLTSEFQQLKLFYDRMKVVHNFTTLSMGMSGDYALAIEQGSNMVRVGSAIFGPRQ